MFNRDNDSSGVGALMFAVVCFTIAFFAFSIAFAALHLWALSTLLLRLMEGSGFGPQDGRCSGSVSRYRHSRVGLDVSGKPFASGLALQRILQKR